MPDGTRAEIAGYEADFCLWAADQARRLRALGAKGAELDLDWSNLAEEIESLARKERQEVRNRLGTILEHLIKLQYSTSRDPRWGWEQTVVRTRREVGFVLRDSPSLRRLVPELLADVAGDARGDAAAALAHFGEAEAGQQALAGAEGLEQRVLDDAFIPHPPGAATSG